MSTIEKKLFAFNWKSGGWNSVWAHDLEGARLEIERAGIGHQNGAWMVNNMTNLREVVPEEFWAWEEHELLGQD